MTAAGPSETVCIAGYTVVLKGLKFVVVSCETPKHRVGEGDWSGTDDRTVSVTRGESMYALHRAYDRHTRAVAHVLRVYRKTLPEDTAAHTDIAARCVASCAGRLVL